MHNNNYKQLRPESNVIVCSFATYGITHGQRMYTAHVQNRMMTFSTHTSDPLQLL